MSVGTGSFIPVRTMPPLRELAPQPNVSDSNTATFTPRFARARAAESPQNPPPTTATSIVSGRVCEAAIAGEPTVVAQKFFSWMVIGEMAEEILTLTAGYKTIGGVHIKKGRRQGACRLLDWRSLFVWNLRGLLFLAVDASCEKQSVRWPGVPVVAEGERPQSIDGQDGIVGVLHEAHELIGEAIESGNPAAAEITDENGVAELTKVARGPDDSPGCIHPGAVLKVADVFAGGREDFNKAEAVTGHVIVPGGVLLGVSDKESAADILHVERSETARNAFGFKCVFIEAYALEDGVIDFDLRGTEIRDVEKFVAVDFAGGCAFVDGTIRGAVIGVIDDENGVLSAVPAGDRSIFRGKDEVGGFAGSNQKIRWTAIEHDTRGSRGGSCWRAIRGRNRDVASAINWNSSACAVVESGSAGIVVGDPPRAAAWRTSQSPRVFYLGVRGVGGGNRGQIRN